MMTSISPPTHFSAQTSALPPRRTSVAPQFAGDQKQKQEGIGRGAQSLWKLVVRWPALTDRVLGRKIFSWDTPEAVAERQRILKTVRDFHAESGVLSTGQIHTPEREHLRSNILDEVYGDGAARKEKKAYILTGEKGAGKTTLSIPLTEETGAHPVDSAPIRTRIPEYQQTRCDEICHDEVRLIRAAQLERATENADNIVVTVPPKKGELTRLAHFLKDQGYQTHLIFVDTAHIVERVRQRFEETGRYNVAFRRSLGSGKKVAKLYDTLKEANLYDRCFRINNDGSMEEAQEKVREIARG